MEANKLDKSLLSGSTTLLLLQLLSEREMYGYEMIETLRDRSLYPLLHGLEEKGFLEAYEREAGGKTRKYYRITKKGHRHLDGKKEEWETYETAVRRVLGGPAYEGS